METKKDECEIISVYDDITKPIQDKRLYRGIELRNGIKILLISDPITDMSSAALDVHVGYMCDPPNLSGVAHLCEHMLFQASTKYPKRNQFQEFLVEHCGGTKAFTSGEHSNYYFYVHSDHFSPAFDMFAHFFSDPAFLKDGLSAAIDAVNAEYESRLQCDIERLNQFNRSAARRDHPYGKFGEGNKLTLDILPKSRGVNVHKLIVEFFTRWYSPNIMTLVVLGKESLEELSNMVVPIFSLMPNKNVEIPEWSEHPYGPEQIGVRACVVPIQENIHKLNVDFPILEQDMVVPCHYIAHIIDHEGPGTLFSELKSRRWLNNLLSGFSYRIKGFASFVVDADLTEEGSDHVNEIMPLLFSYVNLIREEGPMEWRFEECRDLLALNFRFQQNVDDPQSLTSSLAEELHDFPLEDVLSGPYLLRNFRPEMIRDLLDRLTPRNVRVVELCKKYAGTTDGREPWYGVKYRQEKIDDGIIDKWKRAGVGSPKNLRLPPKNEFIPVNFQIVEREQEYDETPIMIKETALCRLWFRQSRNFHLPKTIIGFKISTPMASLDPCHCNVMYMFVQLFNRAFSEHSYTAEISGYSFTTSNTKYGMLLTLKGYSDKLMAVVLKMFEVLTDNGFDANIFDSVKNDYLCFLKNFQNQQPYENAVHNRNLLLLDPFWSNEELLEAAEDLTADRFQELRSKIFSNVHVEALVLGNLRSQQASALIDLVEDQFLKKRTNSQPFPFEERIKIGRQYYLPDGCHYLFERSSSACCCSAIEVYFQCGRQEPKLTVSAELFVRVVFELCYHILRIHEQLGYIVHIGVDKRNGTLGIRFVVQSDRHPAYIDARIEAFLLHVGKYLENLDELELQKHKSALLTRLGEHSHNLSQLFSKYWLEIRSQQYRFDRDKEELACLQTLSKDDLCNFYKKHLFHAASRRKKLAVQIVSVAEGNTRQQLEGSPQETDFHKDSCLFPVPEGLPPYDVIHNVADFKTTLRISCGPSATTLSRGEGLSAPASSASHYGTSSADA